MPSAAMRPCSGGCGALVVHSGKCAACKRRTRVISDSKRPNAHQRGYDRRWKRERLLFLRAHPMCECEVCNGQMLPATVVDHIVPHRGNRTLFWDQSNWCAMAKSCHDRKTALEDGGFGNARKQEAA